MSGEPISQLPTALTVSGAADYLIISQYTGNSVAPYISRKVLVGNITNSTTGGTLSIDMAGGNTNYVLSNPNIVAKSRLQLTPQTQMSANLMPQLWVPPPTTGQFLIEFINDGTSNIYSYTYEISF